MAEHSGILSFTDLEVRSYLPSGWGIVPGATGTWSAGNRTWTVDVYDGADHVWPVDVTAADAWARSRAEASLAATEGEGR